MQITTPDQYTYQTITYRLEAGISYVLFKAKACHDVHLGWYHNLPGSLGIQVAIQSCQILPNSAVIRGLVMISILTCNVLSQMHRRRHEKAKFLSICDNRNMYLRNTMTAVVSKAIAILPTEVGCYTIIGRSATSFERFCISDGVPSSPL